MFVNNQFTIYSEHTLFVVDENQKPQRCLNEYSDLEVIRVLFPNGETRDYPIEDEVTLVPPLALVFFSKEEDAYRYSQIIDTDEGLDIVLSNAESSSRRSKFNEEFPGTMKNGVYCIPYFDSNLSDWTWLNEIRFLNENMDIKKPIPVTESDKAKFVRYMTMHDVDSHINYNLDRLLFEVVSEDGKTYINHFIIQPGEEINDAPIYITRNYQFPIFSSKEYAWKYRYFIQNGSSKHYWITSEQRRLCNCTNALNEKRRKKKIFYDAVEFVAKYAWQNSDKIWKYGKDFISTKRKKKG
jgi:hypothetical protein